MEADACGQWLVCVYYLNGKSLCVLGVWDILLHVCVLGYVAMCIPRDDLLHAYWDIKVCVGLLANVSACVLCVMCYCMCLGIHLTACVLYWEAFITE